MESDGVLVYIDGQPRFVPQRVDCHYAARGALGVPRGVAVKLDAPDQDMGAGLVFEGGHTFVAGQRYYTEVPQ